jgi:hypothetical protein
MLKLLRKLFNKPKELDVKGLRYDDGDGSGNMTAYYFESFNGWVSMDEPKVFHNINNETPDESPLNEWLIKVREGLKLEWWEIQLLEDNHLPLLKMYWKKS